MVASASSRRKKANAADDVTRLRDELMLGTFSDAEEHLCGMFEALRWSDLMTKQFVFLHATS